MLTVELKIQSKCKVCFCSHGLMRAEGGKMSVNTDSMSIQRYSNLPRGCGFSSAVCVRGWVCVCGCLAVCCSPLLGPLQNCNFLEQSHQIFKVKSVGGATTVAKVSNLPLVCLAGANGPWRPRQAPTLSVRKNDKRAV